MNFKSENIYMTLQEGKDVVLDDYYKHCKIYTVKTFYYFIELLLGFEKGRFIVSSYFREQIGNKLGDVFTIKPRFNPEGWFGRSWTEGHLDRSSYFRKIYSEVLERTETEPYQYRIKPEYYDIVKETFNNLDSNMEITKKNRTESKTTTSDLDNSNADNSSSIKIYDISELVKNSNFPFNMKNLVVQIKNIKGIVYKISTNGDFFILNDGTKERKFNTDFLKSKFI